MAEGLSKLRAQREVLTARSAKKTVDDLMKLAEKQGVDLQAFGYVFHHESLGITDLTTLKSQLEKWVQEHLKAPEQADFRGALRELMKLFNQKPAPTPSASVRSSVVAGSGVGRGKGGASGPNPGTRPRWRP